MIYPLPSTIQKVICYVRKSREEELQEEKDPSFNALERQRIQMERVLKQYNIPFDVEMEIGSGDKIETRPVFQKILKKIENDEYQAIAVREIQRLGRGSYEDMGKIYSLFERKRIFIITENRIWDVRNPDDAKFIRMQLFMSREELFFINERLIGAKYFFASQGKFMTSRPAYGYKVNHKTKVLEIDEEKAKYVRLIFHWYVYGDSENPSGLGYQAIATRLSSMTPTPTGGKTWQPLVVRRILRNRVYLGEIIYRSTERIGGKQIQRPESEWIIKKNAHPAIIDEETFNFAQEKMNGRLRNLPVPMDFSPCELAGIATCGNCGKKLVRQYSVQKYKKENGEISTYHKEFLYCRSGCRMSVKYRDTERIILQSIREFAELDSELLEQELLNLVNGVKRDEYEEKQEIIKAIEEKIKKHERQLKFIYEAYENGDYTREEFLQRRDEVNKELSKTKREFENLTKDSKIETLSPEQVNRVKETFSNLIDVYHSLDNKTEKNDLLRKIVLSAYIGIKEKGIGRRPATLDVKVVLNPYFVSHLILT